MKENETFEDFEKRAIKKEFQFTSGKKLFAIYGKNISGLYHGNDITGKSTKIIMKFFKEESLNDFERKFLKWYVIQWISGMEKCGCALIPENYKERIWAMDMKEFRQFIPGELLDHAIDPF